MSVPTRSGAARCAVHPGRPAADSCPVCGRPRCGADALTSRGCLGCVGTPAGERGEASALERVLRAGVGAALASMVAGEVVGEYVGAGVFGLVVPFLAGVLCGEVASRAAGGPRSRRTDLGVRAAAAFYSVCAVALGLLRDASTGTLAGAAVLPYAAALAGAVLWTAPSRGTVRTSVSRPDAPAG